MEGFIGTPGLIAGLGLTVVGFFLSKAGTWQVGVPMMVFGIIGIVASARSLFGA